MTHPKRSGKWTQPIYSPSQVKKAGERLAKLDETNPLFHTSLDIMSNWRASHAFPLNTFQMTLRSRALSIDPTANVVQRLKRAESIIGKLRRPNRPNLAKMQDLGGCRAIMLSADLVYQLRNRYMQSKYQTRHQLISEDDYIHNPKPTGYRGIHLVYEYQSMVQPVYNNLRIELQLRSKLQHEWATAVEVADLATKQALKAGRGSVEWTRFFALMGTVYANFEGHNPVPGTPEDQDVLIAEIQELNREQRVLRTLQAYQQLLEVTQMVLAYDSAMDRIGAQDISLTRRKPSDRNLPFYLLKLNTDTREVRYMTFSQEEESFATEVYKEEEIRAAEEGNIDVVVLVAAADEMALRQAYPNYFLDIRQFLRTAALLVPEHERPDLTDSLPADQS